MAIGASLHIGVNRVDSVHYGSAKPLKGCENDARSLAAIMVKQAFSDVSVLLTASATADAVTKAILAATAKLRKGDLFVLTYSGHGGQVYTKDPYEGEYDETWLLHDREFLDNELCSLLREFSEGVRVLILLDNCHSGTMYQALTMNGTEPSAERIKTISEAELKELSRRHSRLYGSIWKKVQSCSANDFQASIVYMSACADTEVTEDGTVNGSFTSALLEIWDDGRFTGSLEEFHRKVQTSLHLRPDQSPQFWSSDQLFVGQRPFTV